MEFSDGQHFVGTYPPEAREWCEKNSAILIVDGDGFTIKSPNIHRNKLARQAQELCMNIVAELTRIDQQSTRASRAITLSMAKGETPNEEDIDILDEYEKNASSLRKQLSELDKL